MRRHAELLDLERGLLLKRVFSAKRAFELEYTLKIGQFLDNALSLQLGVVVPRPGPIRVLNLSAAGRAQSHRPYFSVMNNFIAGGKSALESGYTILEWALRQGDESWFHDEPSIPWQLPLQVRNCIAGGRNFGAHMAESMEYWKQRGVQTHTEIPMAFIKLASSIGRAHV